MDYYARKLFLAQIDKEDNLVGKVERWQAHEKALLHRGFTVILTFNNQIILQHRRHPAFDHFFDLSFSSHPVFINDKFQSMEEAIFNTLNREWNLFKNDLSAGPIFLDKFYYFAKDPQSIYTEHEIDYIYAAKLNRLPNINPDFAYDIQTVNIPDIKSQIVEFRLAPWVKKILENKIIQQHLRHHLEAV